jgi:predicted phosphodiesterase
MRALVIGDIHTESDLLAQALLQGAASGVRKILSVGDIVDGPGDPLACITQLRTHRATVVRGNHERWVVEGNPMEPFDYPHEALDWFAELPATVELATPTGRVLLGHGIGDDDMLELDSETYGYALENLDPLWALIRGGRYRWLIGGHTHRPMVRTIEGLTIVNAGTLVSGQEPGFVIADFATGEVEHWRLLPALQRDGSWKLGDPDVNWTR